MVGVPLCGVRTMLFCISSCDNVYNFIGGTSVLLCVMYSLVAGVLIVICSDSNEPLSQFISIEDNGSDTQVNHLLWSGLAVNVGPKGNGQSIDHRFDDTMQITGETTPYLGVVPVSIKT